jgi:lysozyme
MPAIEETEDKAMNIKTILAVASAMVITIVGNCSGKALAESSSAKQFASSNNSQMPSAAEPIEGDQCKLVKGSITIDRPAERVIWTIEAHRAGDEKGNQHRECAHCHSTKAEIVEDKYGCFMIGDVHNVWEEKKVSPCQINFKLLRSDKLKEGYGAWIITSLSPNQTRLELQSYVCSYKRIFLAEKFTERETRKDIETRLRWIKRDAEAADERSNADTTKYLQGFDISQYESNVDWAKVSQSAKMRFCFIRASHGLGADESFDQHRKGAKSIGLPRGFYHYLVPTLPVSEQVSLFVRTVKFLEPGDLPPVLDIEDPPAWSNIKPEKRLQLVLDWLHGTEAALGTKPIVYCDFDFVRDTLSSPAADIEQLAQYRLWIAEWHVSGDRPNIPSPWNTWSFWQYSDRIIVPGVDAKDVDGNVFSGSAGELIKLQRP